MKQTASYYHALFLQHFIKKLLEICYRRKSTLIVMYYVSVLYFTFYSFWTQVLVNQKIYPLILNSKSIK